MNTFLLDLRQSLRSLWKSPGFLVAAVLSLALGIGANLAAFSVLRAALAPKLAWKNPHELVFVGRRDDRFPGDRRPISYPRFKLWQQHQTAVAPLAATAGLASVLGGPFEPRSIRGQAVSPEFWPMLQVQPLLGRLPQGEEEGVMVASHKLWTSALGGDPGVIGKPYTVGGRPFTLVGVLPAGAVWGGAELFVPLTLTEQERVRQGNWLRIVGRRRPGLTDADVQTAFRTLSTQLQATVASEKPITAVPRPLLEADYGSFRDGQKLLGWVSLFVTALACVNLCVLALGRSAARLQELGIRQALGASRAQLFMPLFADLLVAAVPGMALGWFFSLATGSLLDAFLPNDLQTFHGASPMDLGLAMGVALALAVLGAALPALLLPRMRTFGLLGGTRTSGSPARQWSQKGLVALQVGLALTLLSSFGLVYRSLRLLKAAPIGIATEGRLVATLSLPMRSPEEGAQRQVELAQALDKLRALPGVEAAGGVNLLPLISEGWGNGNIDLPGHTAPVFAHFRDATDGYFEAAGIPVVEGRGFRSSDLAGEAQSVIVSQSFARDYFPGQSIVGRTLPYRNREVTVIGVVGDTLMGDAPNVNIRQTRNSQTLYFPGLGGQVELLIKAPGTMKALLPEVRRILRAQWPALSLDRVRPIEEALELGNAGETRRTALMGLLAGLALLLTVTGIYGVLSRQVETRRREIGIRMAMGGLGPQIVGLIVQQAMVVVGIGLLLGTCGALALGRLLQNQLFQVQPTDPLTHLATLALLATAALMACLIPALRAASVHPAEALRNE